MTIIECYEKIFDALDDLKNQGVEFSVLPYEPSQWRIDRIKEGELPADQWLWISFNFDTIRDGKPDERQRKDINWIELVKKKVEELKDMGITFSIKSVNRPVDGNIDGVWELVHLGWEIDDSLKYTPEDSNGM